MLEKNISLRRRPGAPDTRGFRVAGWKSAREMILFPAFAKTNVVHGFTWKRSPGD
jgi:hypothetical protein